MQSSFCLKKLHPRYETRDARRESTWKQWVNAGWWVQEKDPSTQQPSAAKDAVAKGYLTSGSEEELLQLNQDSAIKLY